MYRLLLKSLAIAVLLNVTSFGQSAQSLGDIARANREKQAAEEAAGTIPKVFTNKDVPAVTPIPEADASQPMTTVSGVSRSFEGRSSGQPFADQRLSGQRAGEQWRGRIQAQESRIAELQARIDQMNAALHHDSTVQYSGPYNPYQARQMQRLALMQELLDQQRRGLYLMQEAARRAGMHTSVYDP